MAKSTAVFSPKALRTGQVDIVNATGTGAATIAAAGANDRYCNGIGITSTDTSARVLELIINDGSTDHVIGAVTVPITAGTDGSTSSVNALASAMLPFLPKDDAGNAIIPLPAGTTLKAKMAVAVTAAKTISVTAFLKDY